MRIAIKASVHFIFVKVNIVQYRCQDQSRSAVMLILHCYVIYVLIILLFDTKISLFRQRGAENLREYIYFNFLFMN